MDYVRQEEPATDSRQVQSAEPRDNIRKVAFTSAGTEEEKDKEGGTSTSEQT